MRQLKRLPQNPVEGFPARIFERQHPAAVVADESQRPRRPGGVELLGQSKLVLELPERRGRLMRGDRGQQQDGRGIARLPAPVKSEEAAFPQGLEQISGKFGHARPPHRWRYWR